MQKNGGTDCKPINVSEAEIRYRSLFEQSPDGILLIDMEGRILEFNEAAHRQLEYTREEFATLKLTDIDAVEKPKETLARIRQLLATGGRAEFDVKHRTKAGEIRDVHVISQVITLSGDKLFHVIWHDITEQKRMVEELRQAKIKAEDERARAEAVLAAIGDPIGIQDTEFRIKYQNDAHKRIVGDRLGEHCYRVYHGRDNVCEGCQLEMAFKDGRIHKKEQTRTVAEGTFYYETTASPLRDATGKIIAGVEASRDITERKRAEIEIGTLNQQLQDKASELEVAYQDMESFGFTVSHDLQAPLRYVVGFIRLLQKELGEQLNEKGRKYMVIITESTQKMQRLIDDLLAFSRLRHAGMQPQKVNLKELLEEVIGDLLQENQGRDIVRKVDELPEVFGDQAMLRLALVNLVSNAVKFTSQRPIAKIECGSSRNEREFVFFVRDNGVGFDMKYAARLFGAFQRLHSGREFEGAGIGLSIVKRIIRRHGGRVWAEGEPDAGATFYFTLPVVHNRE